MPIIKSAKKALRGSQRKQVFNLRRNRVMKETVKEVHDFVQDKNTEEAKKKLPMAYKAIDKALKSGVIKKNTAARKKSRLARAIKKAS
jgi:small subunit ribosomal protein S20